MNMPALTINLLSKKREQFEQQQQTGNKVKLISGIFLAIYIVILSGVFLVNLYYLREANEVSEAIKQVKLSLSIKLKDQVEFVTVAIKTQSISNIINERLHMSMLWKALQQMMPVGASVESFSYGGSNLAVTIKANHFVSASKIIDILEQSQQGFKVDRSTVNINRSNDAAYRLSVTMNLSGIKPEGSQ